LQILKKSESKNNLKTASNDKLAASQKIFFLEEIENMFQKIELIL